MADYRDKPKKYTMSHKLLIIILCVYVFIIVYCSIIIGLLMDSHPEDISTIIISLLSYSSICGSSTIVCYCNKAREENKLQISLNKYRMKLDLAKEIYRDISNGALDDKSISLIKSLSETETADDNVELYSNNFSKPDVNGLG